MKVNEFHLIKSIFEFPVLKSPIGSEELSSVTSFNLLESNSAESWFFQFHICISFPGYNLSFSLEFLGEGRRGEQIWIVYSYRCYRHDCHFMRIWNLPSHSKGRTQIKDVGIYSRYLDRGDRHRTGIGLICNIYRMLLILLQKTDETGGTCNTHEQNEKCTHTFLSGEHLRREQGIILKLVFEK